MSKGGTDMPDFTIETRSQCRSLSVHHANVGGYEQSGLHDERCWPTCTCPAYKFSKRTINFGGQTVPPHCKHIREAEEKACGWHEMFSPERQAQKGVCPRCGGETEYVRVAV
jgi:hypothetical protein